MTLTITSAAFSDGAEIPLQYTCQGADFSPPIAWIGVPDNAKSLVFILDDPDAPDPAKPQRVWVHWVLYNIPPDAMGLPEGVSDSNLPAGTEYGRND
jgi:Raf kinase inhibitor-like YbhB/YbcL family protein